MRVYKNSDELERPPRSPSSEVLVALADRARRERQVHSAPSSPRATGALGPQAKSFIEWGDTPHERVAQSLRLLERVVKSPGLMPFPSQVAELQRSIQHNLLAHAPAFEKALALARLALMPPRSMVNRSEWQGLAQSEAEKQLNTRGLRESADFRDILTGRLRQLARSLPGSQAAAALLWQRFTVDELMTLLGRPQRAWFAQVGRKVCKEGVCRAALEMRLYFRGDDVGCPALVLAPGESLTGLQRKHLALIVNEGFVEEVLRAAYPSLLPPPPAQREQLLLVIERWLYDIAISCPQPVVAVDALQNGAKATDGAASAELLSQRGERRSSVNFTAQMRYFDRPRNRALERRLSACEEALAAHWTPIFREGIDSIVADLVGTLAQSGENSKTVRAGLADQRQ